MTKPKLKKPETAEEFSLRFNRESLKLFRELRRLPTVAKPVKLVKP